MRWATAPHGRHDTSISIRYLSWAPLLPWFLLSLFIGQFLIPLGIYNTECNSDEQLQSLTSLRTHLQCRKRIQRTVMNQSSLHCRSPGLVHHAIGEEEHWAQALVPWSVTRWGDQWTGVCYQQYAGSHHQTAGQSQWVSCGFVLQQYSHFAIVLVCLQFHLLKLKSLNLLNFTGMWICMEIQMQVLHKNL